MKVCSKGQKWIFMHNKRNFGQPLKIFYVWVKYSIDFKWKESNKKHTNVTSGDKIILSDTIIPKTIRNSVFVNRTVLPTQKLFFFHFVYHCKKSEEQRHRKDCQRRGWHDKVQNDTLRWITVNTIQRKKTFQSFCNRYLKKSWFSSSYISDHL